MSAAGEGRGGGALELQEVTRRFDEVVAVDRVSLDVEPGEFVTLLGPSGSGKTTTLGVIAGFLQPDSGSVVLDGREMGGVPQYRRDIGVVFQNYALFPHMTAAQNVAFPLQMRAVARSNIRRRVEEALELTHLAGLGGRSPRQLSGGQQQRVALARAIVFEPRLLLMDEPLGALDKKLREALQLEVTRISRQLGVTVVYVTHDQEEALVMSDRIAIYNQGRIEQVGSGEDLYERPASLFVADFIGESNIFRGHVEGGVLVTDTVRLPLAGRDSVPSGERAALVVRPERLRVEPSGGGYGRPAEADDGTIARAAGVVREVLYLGSTRKYVVEVEGGTLARARVPVDQDGSHLAPGTQVELCWPCEHGVLVRDESAAAQDEPQPIAGLDIAR